MDNIENDTMFDSTTSSTTENLSAETTTSAVYPETPDYSDTLTGIYLVLCCILVALGIVVGCMFGSSLFKRWF